MNGNIITTGAKSTALQSMVGIAEMRPRPNHSWLGGCSHLAAHRGSAFDLAPTFELPVTFTVIEARAQERFPVYTHRFRR